MVVTRRGGAARSWSQLIEKMIDAGGYEPPTKELQLPEQSQKSAIFPLYVAALSHKYNRLKQKERD
jgi:hypothetical protein